MNHLTGGPGWRGHLSDARDELTGHSDPRKYSAPEAQVKPVQQVEEKPTAAKKCKCGNEGNPKTGKLQQVIEPMYRPLGITMTPTGCSCS